MVALTASRRGLGKPMLEVGQDIREMAPNERGYLGDRREPAVGGVPESAGEERLRGRETFDLMF